MKLFWFSKQYPVNLLVMLFSSSLPLKLWHFHPLSSWFLPLFYSIYRKSYLTVNQRSIKGYDINVVMQFLQKYEWLFYSFFYIFLICPEKTCFPQKYLSGHFWYQYWTNDKKLEKSTCVITLKKNMVLTKLLQGSRDYGTKFQ